ncbi:MAG: ABC transporter permease [Candidatus Alcyoniella australis]|nr:ABC transporter permease [Candidatus Alcyoniella australis]
MSAYWRRLWAAIKIGWAVESNWTHTWVFVIYSAVRPLALCLVLYFLFRLVYQQPATEQAFIGVYVANAFFTLVITLCAGTTWAIINDREHYYIIRYIYVSPIRMITYVLGRSVPLLMLGLSSLLIILVFGRYVLEMPIGLDAIRWELLLPASILGVVCSMALGIFFAGFCLVTAKHSMMLAEGVGGVFLLLCGVIFPVDIMPAAFRVAGLALPVTYWMEATRRAFGVQGFSAMLTPLSDINLMLILLIGSALLLAASVWAFHGFEHLAVKHGKIDQATNY